MHIYIKNNTLSFDGYKVKCAVGKRGIGVKKKEGDMKTPVGKFKFDFLMYRKDRVRKVKCNFKKITIKKNLGWCDDPKSNFYNKLIKFPFEASAEKLFLKKNIYDLILTTNFNTKPTIKNKGSAIFFHISDKTFSPTRGCIAVKKNEFLKILPLITKKTRLIIN